MDSVVGLRILSGGGVECTSYVCAQKKECANHATAEGYRAEVGMSPDLSIDLDLWAEVLAEEVSIERMTEARLCLTGVCSGLMEWEIGSVYFDSNGNRHHADHSD